MKVTYLTNESFQDARWSGGVTRELFIFPKEASYKERTFTARLSTATIENSFSTFTRLEGVRRFICTITQPILLKVDGKEIFLLPFEVFEFSGDSNVESYGMTQDFNLMLKDEKIRGEMKTIRNEENMSISTNEKGILCIFSFSKDSEIFIGNETYRMDESSLLIIRDLGISPIDISVCAQKPIIVSFIEEKT